MSLFPASNQEGSPQAHGLPAGHEVDEGSPSVPRREPGAEGAGPAGEPLGEACFPSRGAPEAAL